MSRLTGKSGAVYVSQGGIGKAVAPNDKIADIFNINFELEIETAECGVKLEVNETYALGKVTCHLTADRYIDDSVTAIGVNPEVGGAVMGSHFAANVPAAGNSYLGFTVQWEFFSIDSVANKGFVVSGEGFVERVTQSNPRGMAIETWEIRCTNSPSLGFIN